MEKGLVQCPEIVGSLGLPQGEVAKAGRSEQKREVGEYEDS